MREHIQVERRRHDFYKILFDTALDAIIVIDENYFILDANDKTLSMFGYSFDEMINMSFLELSTDIERTKSSLEENTQYVYNRLYKKKDGTIFPIEGSVARFSFDNKNVLILTIKDITDIELLKLQEKQTHINYRTLFNTIDDFLFVLDLNGNIIHMNTTVVDRLGYSFDELIGRSVLDIHPSDRREETETIIKKMSEGSLTFCPVPVVTKSGVQIPVETRITHGIWNNKPAIFGVTKDISRLTLSEEKFSKLFYINPNACGLSNYDTHEYIEVNEAFYKLLEFEKDEVIGRTVYDLMISTKEDLDEIMANSDNNGNVTNVEANLKTKHGDIKTVLLSSETFYVQDIRYRFTVVQDITEQNTVEQKINDQMTFLTTLLETIPGPVFYKDTSGKYLGCNAAFEKHFAITRDKMIGKTAQELWSKEIAESYINNDEKILDNPEKIFLYDGVSKAIGSDEIRDIIVNKAVYIDAVGNVAGIVGVVTDITDKKRAMDALAVSEAKYRAIVEDQVELICRFAPDGKLTFVNKAYCDYFGKEYEDLVGKQFMDLIDPEDRELVENSFKSITKDVPYHYDHKIILSSGEVRWQHWSDRAIFCENGNIKEYQSIGFDITDRKYLEEKVLKSKLKYRAILDTLQDGFYQTDKDGNICFVSQTALELLGYADRSEAIGKPVTSWFFNPDDREEFLDRLKRSGGKIYDQELLLINKNEELVITSINAQIRVDEFGNFNGTQGVIRDITEHKRHLNEITKLYHVVEGSQNGLVVIELDGTISYANRAVLQIAKSPDTVTVEEHALGRKIKSFISFDLPLTISTVCKIVETDGKWFGPAYLFCACSDYDRVPIDVMFSKITDDNEKSYIVASFTETSEIIALTRKVQEQSRMYEELKDNMEILVGKMNSLNETKIKDINRLEQEFSASVREIKSLDLGGANVDTTE